MHILIDIFALSVLLILTSIALKKGEIPDLKCPQGPYTEDKSQCREGNGKSYAGSQPAVDDSSETLLKKIEIAATAARKDILWRRCFLPAVAATLCLFGLVLRRFPRWFELLSATFFIMMPIYFMQTFYSHHHYAHIEKNIQNSLTFLREHFTKHSTDKIPISLIPDRIPPLDRISEPDPTKGKSGIQNKILPHKKKRQNQQSDTQPKVRRIMKQPAYD